MNIYDLRKAIHVAAYDVHSNGCSIYYAIGAKSNALNLNREQLFEELIAICTYENNYHDRTEFDESYSISQWDALNIAIRHELMLEADKEIDNSDIGKAIDKLKSNINA